MLPKIVSTLTLALTFSPPIVLYLGSYPIAIVLVIVGMVRIVLALIAMRVGANAYANKIKEQVLDDIEAIAMNQARQDTR